MVSLYTYGFGHEDCNWAGSLSSVSCLFSLPIPYHTHRTYCTLFYIRSIYILPFARLLGDVFVVPALEDLDRHAHLDPALQVLG